MICSISYPAVNVSAGTSVTLVCNAIAFREDDIIGFEQKDQGKEYRIYGS